MLRRQFATQVGRSLCHKLCFHVVLLSASAGAAMCEQQARAVRRSEFWTEEYFSGLLGAKLKVWTPRFLMVTILLQQSGRHTRAARCSRRPCGNDLRFGFVAIAYWLCFACTSDALSCFSLAWPNQSKKHICPRAEVDFFL